MTQNVIEDEIAKINEQNKKILYTVLFIVNI